MNHVRDSLQLWRDVAVAVAGTEGIKERTGPANWADATMKGYMETLKKMHDVGMPGL